MKKILTLALLLFLVGCQTNDIEDEKVTEEPVNDKAQPTELTVFDLEELSKYDGIVMEKMYIAVDGFVYDVTDVESWSTGEHKGLLVGKDVTEGFNISPHSEETLAELTKVGTLVVTEFTLAELAMYNGVEMDKTYIAVDGIVYDVTGVDSWNTGEHHGYMVGADVTEGFAKSPHAMATLDNLMIVGILVE